MTESELIELLLLRNRGAVDAPEIRLFDEAIVLQTFIDILRAGYLRSLDSIPAIQIFSRSYAQYVFSSSGRIRFYHLERLLPDSSPDNGIPDSIPL
jgi:hypothetical protein